MELELLIYGISCRYSNEKLKPIESIIREIIYLNDVGIIASHVRERLIDLVDKEYYKI